MSWGGAAGNGRSRPGPAAGSQMRCCALSALAVYFVGFCIFASGAAAGAAATGRPAATHVARHQDLVRLMADHVAWAAPNQDGAHVAVVHAWRPLTGEPTVLPLLTHFKAPDGQFWLEVRLPGRPLRGQAQPQTGWILGTAVSYTGTVWHIVVQTAKHRALIFNTGRLLRTFSVITGKSSTPTPTGDFFVEENIQLGPGDLGAPFALATSARSAVLQEFNGGPGQIALHGLGNIGGRLGTAVSHGCIRFSNAAIAWLAPWIVNGTPVTLA